VIKTICNQLDAVLSLRAKLSKTGKRKIRPELKGVRMQIGLEDFRVATETGGMQLDDDSLLALFSKVMPQGHTLSSLGAFWRGGVKRFIDR
jgi:hypothetical protein